MESLAFMHLVWSEAGVVGNSTPDSDPSSSSPFVTSVSLSLWPLRMAQLEHQKEASGVEQEGGRMQAELHTGAQQLYFLWVRGLMPALRRRLHKPFCTGCLPT